MNLPEGHLLQNGKYRLINVVGQGGFGITYKGVWYTEVKGSLGAMKTEVPIAVKEYFFKDYCYRAPDSFAVKVHSETGRNLFGRFKEKLIQEARILSEVHHAHIVNVLEVFEENGTAYIAMEYIAGLSLKQMMEKEKVLPEAQALEYIRQIGEALHFVHQKSIIHLDIKPSNILIDKNDNAYLIDFGVSKRFDEDWQETSTTMLTLSKGFASIEQYDSDGVQNFSPYPDIYSLGATLYNLLTGQVPTESILRATRPLTNPAQLNPHISPRTAKVILKAMQIVPTERFETVQEMIQALQIRKKKAQSKTKEELPRLPLSNDKVNAAAGNSTAGNSVAGNNATDNHRADNADEQTIVSPTSIPVVTPLPKKKKSSLKKVMWAAVIIVVVILTFSWYSDSPDIIPAHSKSEEKFFKVTPEPEEVSETMPSSQTERMTSSQTETPSQKSPESRYLSQSSSPSQPVEKVMEKDREKTDKEAQAAELIRSARRKMDAANYVAAKTDLEKAYAIKPTDLVKKPLQEVEAKLKEQRLERYEVKDIPFGELRIAKKRETGLYGAIDAEGNERVPCLYIYNEKVKNGRAFARADNLFDLYNERGELVTKGVDSY